MGVHININIDIDKFPKQGNWLGKITDVFFNYDPTRILKGKIVRDDIEEPFKTIIQLEDGRYVLTTECQHSPRG